MRIRALALLSLLFVASLLLTGCDKARERPEARQAAPDATGRRRDAGRGHVNARQGATSTSRRPSQRPPSSQAPRRDWPRPDWAPGSSIATLESGGVGRHYRLYVPLPYDASQPVPLVLNFHGLGSNAVEQERYSGFNDAAEQSGFIVVTPEGTGQPQEWYLYGPVEQGYVDDFAFVDDLLDHLESSFCIDASRVYATGISNGGGMTSLLGCRLNGRIAAIAPVAGSPYAPPLCDGAGPMPVVAFHGTADPLVPFEPAPDVGRLDLFNAGARANMLGWAQHNGCDLTLQTQRIASDVVLESYAGCTDGADVQLYVVEGGGHTWPGADRDIAVLGSTTHSISATELAWRFFTEHPKR